MVFGLAAVLGSLVLGATLLDAGLVDRLTSLFGAPGEMSRWRIWRVALALLADAPAAGWGYGRFFAQGDLWFDQLAPVIDIRSGTHNDLLAAAVEGGPWLLAALAGLYAALGCAAWRARREAGAWPARAAGLALVVLTMGSLFHNALADGELSLPFWALAGLLARHDARAAERAAPTGDAPP